MNLLLPFLFLSEILALDPDPAHAFRVYAVKVQVARASVPKRRDQVSHAANARNQRVFDAMLAWEAGGDSAQTIGTLRAAIGEDSWAHYHFDLGRVLQADGRVSEAAEQYWLACGAAKEGADNPFRENVSDMVRIADALEEAGRHQDAAWAFGQTGQPNRREAYLEGMMGVKPYQWGRKWAKKLLREDPNDTMAKEMLESIEKLIAKEKSQPGSARKTRDIPREPS